MINKDGNKIQCVSIQIQNLIKLSLILLADLNQAQCIFSNLMQLIEKQNDEISHLHNKVVKLQMEKEMEVDTNVEILSKIEMIANEFRMRGVE